MEKEPKKKPDFSSALFKLATSTEKITTYRDFYEKVFAFFETHPDHILRDDWVRHHRYDQGGTGFDIVFRFIKKLADNI